MGFNPFKNLHQKRGRFAEKIVQNKFVDQGFCLLATNYRGIGFEIDLIAQKGHTIVFVEVKYRTFLPHALIELLPMKKKQALIKGARHYLAIHGCNLDFKTARFDLVLFVPYKGYVYFPGVLEL